MFAVWKVAEFVAKNSGHGIFPFLKVETTHSFYSVTYVFEHFRTAWHSQQLPCCADEASWC